KGMVVIVEGKYANTESLRHFHDLRFRLRPNPSHTEARFQIRSRQLSPTDAEMQVVFYGLSLVPSYDNYAERTASGIDAFIEESQGNEWRIVAGQGQLSPNSCGLT